MKFTIIIIHLLILNSSWGEESPKCGQPLVMARIATKSLPSNERPNEASRIYELMQIFSASNIQELTSLVGPMTPLEKSLTELVEKYPFSIVHRIPLDRLKGVFTLGKLLSPLEASQNGHVLDRPFTPPLENSLFGGHGCVFVSLGPPNGRERYGEIIVKMKKDVPLMAWATLSSGWQFYKNKYSVDPTGEEVPSFEDRLHYSHNIYTRSEWKYFFKLAMIYFLREKEVEERRDLIERLQSTTNADDFWNLVDLHRLGFLEGKIPAFISLEHVEKILVPSERRAEIFSWKETSKWADLIKSY